MRQSITIASISPMRHDINRSYGTFLLRGCSPGEEYTTLNITDQVDYKKLVLDDLKTELLPVTIPAQQVVDDLIRAERVCFEPGNEAEHEGIFQCAGDQPTKAELSAARAARRAFLVRSVQHGDGVFSRLGPRAVEQIPDFCKRAVTELGERREWVFQEPPAKVQCPGCGERLLLLDDGSKPALCGKCGAILDREKYVLLFPTAQGSSGDKPVEVEKVRR